MQLKRSMGMGTDEILQREAEQYLTESPELAYHTSSEGKQANPCGIEETKI